MLGYRYGIVLRLGPTPTETLADLGNEMEAAVGNSSVMERMEGLFH